MNGVMLRVRNLPRPERLWVVRNRGDNHMWLETDETKAAGWARGHEAPDGFFDVFEVTPVEPEDAA